MKNLWAPWRMDHVLGIEPGVEHCLFEPPGEARYDKDQLLLYRDHATVVLLNRFPYANGHLLIAPLRHVACLTELRSAEADALMDMVRNSTAILKASLKYDGINIGCNIGETAGASIASHLHFHLVPRWQGDHNYMAVIAEIRTIPEHIERTFDKLLPEFNKL